MARAAVLPRGHRRLALVGAVQHEAPAGRAVSAWRGGEVQAMTTPLVLLGAFLVLLAALSCVAVGLVR
jgi:hypothetical protein